MKNRVCEILKIEKPVIQAPMAWITSPDLVAAVSNAEGLGTLGFNGGFERLVSTPEDNAEETQEYSAFMLLLNRSWILEETGFENEKAKITGITLYFAFKILINCYRVSSFFGKRIRRDLSFKNQWFSFQLNFSIDNFNGLIGNKVHITSILQSAWKSERIA